MDTPIETERVDRRLWRIGPCDRLTLVADRRLWIGEYRCLDRSSSRRAWIGLSKRRVSRCAWIGVSERSFRWNRESHEWRERV